MATYVKHPLKHAHLIPYVVDMLPHVLVGDALPIGAVRKFMNRYVTKTESSSY